MYIDVCVPRHMDCRVVRLRRRYTREKRMRKERLTPRGDAGKERRRSKDGELADSEKDEKLRHTQI